MENIGSDFLYFFPVHLVQKIKDSYFSWFSKTIKKEYLLYV